MIQKSSQDEQKFSKTEEKWYDAWESVNHASDLLLTAILATTHPLQEQCQNSCYLSALKSAHGVLDRLSDEILERHDW